MLARAKALGVKVIQACSIMAIGDSPGPLLSRLVRGPLVRLPDTVGHYGLRTTELRSVDTRRAPVPILTAARQLRVCSPKVVWSFTSLESDHSRSIKIHPVSKHAIRPMPQPTKRSSARQAAEQAAAQETASAETMTEAPASPPAADGNVEPAAEAQVAAPPRPKVPRQPRPHRRLARRRAASAATAPNAAIASAGSGASAATGRHVRRAVPAARVRRGRTGRRVSSPATSARTAAVSGPRAADARISARRVAPA